MGNLILHQIAVSLCCVGMYMCCCEIGQMAIILVGELSLTAAEKQMAFWIILINQQLLPLSSIELGPISRDTRY